MKLKHTFLSAIFAGSMFLSQPVIADSFEQAMAYAEVRNYTKAFKAFKTLAEQGDDRAQYYLGMMYGFGMGTPENKQKALYWLQKSCQAGYQEACNSVKSFQ